MRLSYSALGNVQAVRPIYADAHDGSRFVTCYRVWSADVGFFDVHPHEARCSLSGSYWMTTKLCDATWRSILRKFESAE